MDCGIKMANKSIYLNNIAASLISNPERCGNPISHLHKALLNLSQPPHTSSQAILERRGQAETIAGDDLSSNIQEGTETSTNNLLRLFNIYVQRLHILYNLHFMSSTFHRIA